MLVSLVTACTTSKTIVVEQKDSGYVERVELAINQDKVVKKEVVNKSKVIKKKKIDKINNRQDKTYQVNAKTKENIIQVDNNVSGTALELSQDIDQNSLIRQKQLQDNEVRLSLENKNKINQKEEVIKPKKVVAPLELAKPKEEKKVFLNDDDQLIFHFSYDSVNLDKESVAILVKYAKRMQKDPSIKLRLEGHTDERGSRGYNLALGENRALAIKNILALYDLNDRIKVVSYGEEKPISSKHNADAWGKNRRVELIFY